MKISINGRTYFEIEKPKRPPSLTKPPSFNPSEWSLGNTPDFIKPAIGKLLLDV